MAYDIKTFESQVEGTTEWLSKEFSSVRTGRATPALLDSVQVDSYGAKVPVSQVGSVGTEDARTLRITLWDQSQIGEVEKSINDAGLGVSVVADEKGLRIIFPELTSERREQLLKIAKGKYEEARVSIRKHRDEIMKELEKDEKGGDISKDEHFRLKEDIQKKVDAANKVFDEMLGSKESEIAE